MDWLTIRLDVNTWRGRRGDLADVPVVVARQMMRDGQAQPAESIVPEPRMVKGQIVSRQTVAGIVIEPEAA